MQVLETFIQFFTEGGAFMYPIAIVLAIGVAIAIERYVSLSMAETDNRDMWNRLIPLLTDRSYDRAIEASAKSSAAIAKILNYGLTRMQQSRSRDEIEMAMEESVMETVPRLEKRTHYLATFANIATLLGLLGTIIGLIQAFTAVAGANPVEKADLLSKSISIAMNTTAFGLMAAIPLLLLHAFLSTKTTALVDSIEMASVKFLNTINDAEAQQ